jgi:hypothetical protein
MMNAQAKTVRRISPRDGLHYFFGYYDVPAFDPACRRHLCHRVRFRDRLPVASDVAELGVFDLESGRFDVFAETRAWNFQQGAMLQWFSGSDDLAAYNDFDENDGFVGIIFSTKQKKRMRKVGMPFATISADGSFALSINFPRMYDFRPGYGYCNAPDKWRDEKQPADDGIWLVDIKNNASRLILSLADIASAIGDQSPFAGEKLLVNHITFNPGGTRFLALVRNFPIIIPGAPDGAWHTALITASRDGSDLRVLSAGACLPSHYHWKNDRVFAIYRDGPDGPQLYETTDGHSAPVSAIERTFFRKDGHCSYSPDRRWMLYDSYPDENRLQHIYIYDLHAREGQETGAFYSPPVNPVDIRCDLHPRWSSDGRCVSFDSTHEGFRGLYFLQL